MKITLSQYFDHYYLKFKCGEDYYTIQADNVFSTDDEFDYIKCLAVQTFFRYKEVNNIDLYRDDVEILTFTKEMKE